MKNGGAAFPVPDNVGWDKYSETAVAGMTMRQYYKAAALTGLCMGASGLIGREPSAYAKGPHNAGIVERASVLADSMIEEDEKHETGK